MRRGRRRASREDGEPNTRLGLTEKDEMQERVNHLVARPAALLVCPLTFDRFAEIWNTTQPPDVVAAIQLLDSRPDTGETCGRLKTVQKELVFAEIDTKFRIATATVDNMWSDRDKARCIDVVKPDLSWSKFASHLTPVESNALLEWFIECKKINATVRLTNQTFHQILKMVNTGGQLMRLVPECVLFMSPAKQEKLREQAKASPMPEGYFDLNHANVREMNDFLTKCRLMPHTEHDQRIYSLVSWAMALGG